MNTSHQDVLPLTPEALQQHIKAQTGLTPREVDVVAGLIGGRDSKIIGRLLNISHHTIRNHIQSIYSKLGCNSQQTLIGWLEQQGLHESCRRYYLYLQLQPLFKQLLHDIAQGHDEGSPTLLSIHPEAEQGGIPLATTIEGYLRTAGWEVIDVDCKDVSTQLAQRTFTHVLTWDMPEVSEWDDAIWVNLISDHSQLSSSASIHLKDHPDFYSVMVALLQTWVPDYDASAFQREHQRVMGQALTSTLPILVSDTEPSTATSSHWRLAILGRSMLVMLGGYVGWHQTTHQDSSTTWNLPPLMSYYTERPELTKHIWQQLQQDPGKGTVSLVGLRGMGGVGKTTLALEAIHYPKQHYHFRGWFKAETSELLKTDYLDLGAKMHLFTQQMNDKQKLIAVKEWLEAQPSILLVYDNAPDMSTLRDHLPNRGHILITSRNQRMPHPIDIEGMQESEAITLLNHLIPASLQQQQLIQDNLKKLAKELGYLLLALAQAGAYIG